MSTLVSFESLLIHPKGQWPFVTRTTDNMRYRLQSFGVTDTTGYFYPGEDCSLGDL